MPKKATQDTRGRERGPEELSQEDLDKAAAAGAKPLVQTKLDGRGTTTTNFHGSDFNAAKNQS